MSQKPIPTVLGIVHDVNPLAGQTGAMRVADEVIAARPGTLEPRPGVRVVSAVDATDGTHAVGMGWFGGDPLVHTWDGANAWSLLRSGSLVSDEADMLSPTQSYIQLVQARSNIYFPTVQGLRKISSVEATSAETPTLMEVGAVQTFLDTAGGPEPIPDQKSVAYRLCITRRDSNRYDFRSAPSPWTRVDNYSGAAASVLIRVHFRNVEEGDIVEVYRSYAVDVTDIPPDECFLVGRHTINATDVAAGYKLLSGDHTEEYAFGAALYTNSTREGPSKANYPAPAAVAAVSFADCVWLGNTKERYALAAYFTAGWGASGGPDTKADVKDQAFYYESFTADFTIGSPTVTYGGASSLKVGMYLDQATPGVAGTQIPAGAQIRTIGSGFFTMSANALANGTAATVNARDRITIAGRDIYASGTTVYTTPYRVSTDGMGDSGDPLDGGRLAAREIAALLMRVDSTLLAYSIQDPVAATYLNQVPSAGALLVVRRVNPSGASFSASIYANRGVRFEPYQVETPDPGLIYPDTLSVDSEQDTKPNRLHYSKPDEPEAFPLLNYLSVGAEQEGILALVPLQETLLVFKEDGVYRVSGSAPDNWSVDLVDPNVRISRAEAVDVLDEVAYALTPGGVYAVSSGGAQILTDGSIGEAIRTHTAYGQRCAWVAANRRERYVLVGVNSNTSDYESSEVYCWSAISRQWTRWLLQCGTARQADTTMYFAGTKDNVEGGLTLEVLRTNTAAEGRRPYDRNYSAEGFSFPDAVGDFTGTLLRIDLTNVFNEALLLSWVPKSGDFIRGGEFRALVESYEVNGTNLDITLAEQSLDPGTGTLSAYECIPVVLESQAVFGGLVESAQIRDQIVLFDMTDCEVENGQLTPFHRTFYFRVGLSNDVTDAVEMQTVSLFRPAASDVTNIPTNISSIRPVRLHPSREVSRGTIFVPRLEIDTVGYFWRLVGHSLVFENVSERVAR
jgi:hypothetical protein